MTIAPQNPLSIFRLPDQASFPFACFSVPLCVSIKDGEDGWRPRFWTATR